jgi:RNA polymerase II subunit A-like phosphatase
MPEEYEEGKSPVDNLQTFDWGGVDDELAEFMDGESDSDNASDAGSETSNESQKSARSGDKRKHSTTQEGEGEDSDEESTLAKKQRVANNRTTGLKTVKTPNSEASSLPTPGDTVDGELNKDLSQEDGDDDDDGDYDDELERELMEELEKGEAEAEAVGNGEADGGG